LDSQRFDRAGNGLSRLLLWFLRTDSKSAFPGWRENESSGAEVLLEQFHVDVEKAGHAPAITAGIVAKV
jgi:hypothetical protein